MSDELYDMFIGHEVAHALFTPFTAEDEVSLKEHKCLSAAYKIAEGDKQFFGLAHSYMNIIEDARIERLIKDKFHGLRRDFYVGYEELYNKNFFDTNGKNIAEYSFIDRINLYFKCGAHINVPFSEEEMEFVDMIESTRTFDDVVEVTKKIWKFVKDKNADIPDNIEFTYEDSDEGDDAGESQGLDKNKKRNKFNHDWSSRKMMPDECITQKKFDEKFQGLINTSPYNQHYYYNLPSLNLNNAIVGYKEMLSHFEVCASMSNGRSGYKQAQTDADKFIADSTRVVNILAQSFMAKKAAKDHHRNMIHRTGVIDPVRMMNYKFTDDIFRRMKVVKKGKSHGLVFFVDLSGSMSVILEDTFKQLIQLVLFCKRVNVPFEVYGFTTRLRSGLEMDYRPCDEDMTEYEKNLRSVWNDVKPSHVKSNVDGSPVHPFTLLNLFSSKMNKNEISIATRNLFALTAYYKRSNLTIEIPSITHLSSTPLIETIVAAMTIVPKFRSDYKLDIVNTIFLTDGEPTGIMMNATNSHYMMGSFLFDSDSTFDLKDNMIQMFKEYTGSKAIQFFVSPSYSVGYYLGRSYTDKTRSETQDEYMEWEKTFKKEGWAVTHKDASKYDEQFIIKTSKVDDSDLDEVLSQRTSTVGIRNAFVKAMNASITSRVMLNRFIDIIAVE